MLTLAECVSFKEAAGRLAFTTDLHGAGLCYGVYSAQDGQSTACYAIFQCLLDLRDEYIGPSGEFTELRQTVLFLVLAMSAEDILEVVQQHYY